MRSFLNVLLYTYLLRDVWWSKDQNLLFGYGHHIPGDSYVFHLKISWPNFHPKTTKGLTITSCITCFRVWGFIIYYYLVVLNLKILVFELGTLTRLSGFHVISISVVRKRNHFQSSVFIYLWKVFISSTKLFP